MKRLVTADRVGLQAAAMLPNSEPSGGRLNGCMRPPSHTRGGVHACGYVSANTVNMVHWALCPPAVFKAMVAEPGCSVGT